MTDQTLAAISFSRGIEDAWAKVAALVPRFFAFLVILVIGWFVAKAIAKIVNGILERVGFDQAVERGGQEGARAVEVRRLRRTGQDRLLRGCCSWSSRWPSGCSGPTRSAR